MAAKFGNAVGDKTNTRTTDNPIKPRCRLRLCASLLILFGFVLMCTFAFVVVFVVVVMCVRAVANAHCVNDSHGNNERQS